MGDTSYVKGASVDVAAALDDLYASIPAGDFIVSTGGPETGTAGDAPGTTRTALGLGGAAVLNVGTTAGTVAAGNDSRITGALQASSNLSDVANAATARTNLGIVAGPVAGSGTYAARPATPALGDTYTVTSGQRLGSRYRCTTAGAWELDRVLPPTSVVPAFYWDAERVAEFGASANVIVWDEERGRAPLSLASNRTAAPTVGTASYGAIAPVTWGANSGALRSLETGPTQAMARTMIVVLASVSTAADRAWAGWGGSGGSARTFAVRTRTTGVTGMSFYGTDPWGTGSAPTTTTPTILSARYTGTQYALRQASLSGLSWSYSLSLTTFSMGTYGLGAAAGTLSGVVVGAAAFDTATYETTPAQGEIYAILIYPKALSEAEEEAVGTALAARFGP